MDDATLERFEAMVEAGQDNALLRLSLGQAYAGRGEGATAIAHLEAALEADPNYTAAWKWYGKALKLEGRYDEAERAFRQGIEVARAKGDKQLEREMEVFLKRL